MTTTGKRTSALIAAGAATAVLALALFSVAQDVPAAPRRPGPLGARLIADLDLTPDQVQALEAFRKARMDERRAFREDMDRIRGEMRDLFADPQANRDKIDKLIDRRAKLLADREKGMLAARADRDKIFTPEQRERLKTLRSRLPGRAGLAGRAAMARSWRDMAGRAAMRSRGRAAFRWWLRHPRWRR
jgi:Spy/CpxP family protein refolding chaperone